MFIYVFTVTADNGESTSDTSLSLAGLFDIDIPTVVTSLLQEQKMSDAPSPMYVVTRQDIKRRGYYTLKDIMDDVPGFADMSDANENIAIVRGSFASTTNKILILIDGHRMNDFNLGRYNVDQFLGVDAVERVEFIKGPGSALYGTGALLGVVNIITRKGESVNGTTLRAKIGSFNREAYFTYGKKINDKTDVFCNVSINDAPGDEIDQPARFDNVDSTMTPAAGKIYWNKYPANYSIMTAFSSDYLNVRMRNEHYVRATPRNPNHSFYDWEKEVWKPQYCEDQHFIDATADVPLPFGENAKLIVEPALHFYQLKEQTWIKTYGANRLPPLGSRSGQFTDELRASLKAYIQSQIVQSLNITVGYDGNYTKFLQSMGHSLLDGKNISLSAHYVNTGKLFFNGLFAQGVWKYKKLLSVNLGFRFDAFDDMADPAFTPRVGLIYHPIGELSLKLLYGRSFLAPQWAHQETSTDVNQDFQANPDLKPEIFDGVDFIVDYSFNKLNVYVDGFYNKVSDIISAQAKQYANQGEAQFAGVEAGFKASLFDKVKLDGSISYVNNFDADDNFRKANYTDGELRGVAPIIGRYGIEYSPVENLFILVWGRTYSEVTAYTRESPDNNTIDAWTAIDATINYSIMNFDLQLQILNITDAEYLIADNNGGRLPLPRYEQGFHVSLGYSF